MRSRKTGHRTPYPELNTVLRELVESVRCILQDNCVVACLQGSFAVGDFDDHSDVDFIIVIDRELSELQVSSLQAMHKRIFDLGVAWAKHLGGSYFPKAILRDYTQTKQALWYLDHGSRELVKSTHDNTVVVRWILREKGITLAGPHPRTLINPLPAQVLRQEILTIMTDWGNEILKEPQDFNNRFYQSFIVLCYCQMLHDLHTGVIGSKRTGAEWAKNRLDSSWVDLIDRAWAGRPNPALSIRQPANEVDFTRTLDFVRTVVKIATDYANIERGLCGEEAQCEEPVRSED